MSVAASKREVREGAMHEGKQLCSSRKICMHADAPGSERLVFVPVSLVGHSKRSACWGVKGSHFSTKRGGRHARDKISFAICSADNGTWAVPLDIVFQSNGHCKDVR
eukprot:3279414-Pleurochrysis_carterae.AAC.1